MVAVVFISVAISWPPSDAGKPCTFSDIQNSYFFLNLIMYIRNTLKNIFCFSVGHFPLLTYQILGRNFCFFFVYSILRKIGLQLV